MSSPCCILNYRESVDKLSRIISIFEKQVRKTKDLSLFLPFLSFIFALQAQKEALGCVNDEHLNCGLAWNNDIGLPSLPSLTADVETFIRYSDPSQSLRIILESFCGWTMFAREELECACGSVFLKLRKTDIKIMLNHVLETKENSFVIKQFLGVTSSDRKHLKHHYDFKKKSKVIDNLYIIWICENEVRMGSDKLSVECINFKQDDQFNLLGFKNKILRLTK